MLLSITVYCIGFRYGLVIPVGLGLGLEWMKSYECDFWVAPRKVTRISLEARPRTVAGSVKESAAMRRPPWRSSVDAVSLCSGTSFASRWDMIFIQRKSRTEGLRVGRNCATTKVTTKVTVSWSKNCFEAGCRDFRDSPSQSFCVREFLSTIPGNFRNHSQLCGSEKCPCWLSTFWKTIGFDCYYSTIMKPRVRVLGPGHTVYFGWSGHVRGMFLTCRKMSVCLLA